ncbi:MAG: dTDP-4-dehydrorhamnose 3,5-epimerase family protein [Pseudomonadota bacterium]
MSVSSAKPLGSGGSLLDKTLSESTRDVPTVTAEGRSLRRLIEGVSIRDMPTHTDERGTLFEVFDSRWDQHSEPFTSGHCFTIRPGFVKGWMLHKTFEDRTMVLGGEALLVLFDPRPESSTCGCVSEIFLSERARRMVNVPSNVWHAVRNIGATDALVADFPTRHYQHDDPDKYRLPLDTPLIPYSFGEAKGW